jgi:DNA-binding CsgD family transcriptional regulator
MASERCAQLTERQRACLRLVYRLKTSKEIALELGISRHTVDQRIKAALQTLGVATRNEAARLLAEQENGQYHRLVYQSLDVAEHAGPGDAGLVDHGNWRDSRYSGRTLMEEQARYAAAPPPPPAGFRLPLPETWGVRNALSPWARIGWIIGIAVIAVFAFGIFLAGLEALGKLGWSATQS